ncbi:microtubule-associated protein 6 homolog isoform X2 [Mercenaria mercenaria]|uniref:microtubule-associated protein 6 homolog isoform X2 n=1 Tax=Mercenaria mercenaria TaxID=6596 RepID=UPI001E1D9FAD|nr:microtubule-associated protein 6 homolog isoform X2 [Mercenaria mercenaria]
MYKVAYKEWAWHPRAQSMKPHEQTVASADKTRSQMERKTTYGIDFVNHPLPKKISLKKHKTKVKRSSDVVKDDTQYQLYFPKKSVVSSLQSSNIANAKVIYPSNSQPFQDDTIYNNTYRYYDVATVTASQQSPTKGKDCIDISINHKPVMQEEEQTAIVHRPERLNTAEEKDESKEEFYTMYYVRPGSSPQNSKYKAISTAMADFTIPEGFERPVPCCPPPAHDHFGKGKFDGTTTFSEAYKPFPVHPYELPIWAKKLKYKRPEGGMLANSVYMHDYRDPGVVKPQTPIKPKGNIITKKAKKDTEFEKMSTYKYDFKQWENVRPRETYRIIEVYLPPKEKMMFETNNRSDFKGEKADKMKPCRHISQHRELDTNSVMTFFTTYDETYRNPRPKKPSSGSATSVSGHRRSCSAKSVPAEQTKTSRPATSKSIPAPDLSSAPVLNSRPASADAPANNSLINRHVDILTVNPCCDQCAKSKQECTCVQNI